MAKRKKRKQSNKFPKELIEQAKQAGFIDEQIAAFDSEESLRAAIGRIKPAILASAGTPGKPKPAGKPVELEIKEAKFTLRLSPMRAKTELRADDEQRDIDAYLSRRGI
jgi:hypothetical protein